MQSNHQSEITAWLNAAGRFPLIPPEETNLIARRIQAMPESRVRRRLINKLVSHNLRLVVRLTKTYMQGHGRHRWGSIETLDFLQVGVMGLIRAAEKFDPARGYTFSTYAAHWIRSTIGRHNIRTITPVYVPESASRRMVFFERNGHIKTRGGNGLMPERQIDQLIDNIRLAYSCVSTDYRIDPRTTIGELIPDTNTSHGTNEVSYTIEESLREAGVDPIGCQILIRNYVMSQSLQVIAKDLDMTVDQVRIKKKKAMNVARRRPDAFQNAYTELVPTAP